MTDAPILLPCPFCGSDNIGEDYIETYSLDSSYNVFGCRDCGVRINDGTAADWNRRVDTKMVWRPIDTAPLNTDIILAYYGPNQLFDCYRAIGHMFKWETMLEPRAARWAPNSEEPTHWAPCPPRFEGK